MKFKIIREELIKGLSLASKVSPSKHANHAYTFIKLVLTETELTLTGSNGELSIQTILPVVNNGIQIIRDVVPGSTLVPAYSFNELIKKLECEEISFEILDKSMAYIKTDKSEYQLNVIDAKEFAEMDFSKTGVHIELNADSLAKAVSQTNFAAATKAGNRPYLTSINLESELSKVVFTATDGARLAQKEILLEIPEKIKVNIPVRSLQEVIGMVTNETTIQVYVAANKILFELEKTTVSSSLIGGEYPSTKNIIPKFTSCPYQLLVNAKEFINALDRVSLFSTNDRDSIVKLTMTENRVEISSRSQQNGSGVEELSDFKYSGERLEISFNAEYVKQAVKAFGSPEVSIGFNGEMKPFVLIDNEDKNILQVVTPVRTY